MKSERFTFLVIENAIDVCEGIERRMQIFKNWESLGYCTGIKEAINKVNLLRPHLIYLDWSLNGGSAYEVLQQIQNFPDYNPYIIFNTGFQSDNPEIPQEIINRYKVDKYLIKPFWESLRRNLPVYLKEAEEKATQAFPKSKLVWIKDEHSVRVPLPLNKIICIVQNPYTARRRDFYVMAGIKEITIPITWKKCCELLTEHKINFFITKSRQHLVVKDFIDKFEKPFVRLKGFSMKIEVVKEKLCEFVSWLHTEQ